jgi:hypothetical protein
MKMKSILLAGAVAALPFAAFAQDPNPPQERRNAQTTTTTTTEQITNDATDAAGAVTGKVQTYEVGRTITIVNEKGDAVTYALTDATLAPKAIEAGKVVTIRTTTVSGSPVVKSVTTMYTKETKKKSY